MMSLEFQLTINQLIIMFLLVCLGYGLYKIKMIGAQTTKELGTIILYVVAPSVTIVSFQQSFSVDKLIGFLLCFVYSLGIIMFGLLVGRLLLGSDKKLEQYACGFTNAGFIGIPLVVGILGVEYVFYISAFFVAYNILAWTYGLKLISGEADISFKKLITNPAILSVIVGMILFVTQITLPSPLVTTFEYLGNMNTPLGMIILGTYIANGKIKDIFNNKLAYKVSAIRLVIVPLILMVMIAFVYVPSPEIRTVLLIAAAAPCGTTLAMFSQLYGGDYSYGSRIVSLSTIFCPITIVALLTLSHLLW